MIRRKVRFYMAKQNGSKTAQIVRELIKDEIAGMGYFLWDVEYVKEGTDFNLIVTIDSQNGISLDDCEAVTRAINPILDKADPIADSYYLEVSSAGLERDLKKPEHFTYCLGQEVNIGFFAPYESENDHLNAQKSVNGKLITEADGIIMIEIGGENCNIEESKCSYIRTIASEEEIK